MADSSQPAASVVRDSSTNTRSIASVDAKTEDVKIITMAESDDERPAVVQTKEEDKAAVSDLVKERSASPSPSPVVDAGDTTGETADTTEDADDTTGDLSLTDVQTRCVRNFLDPRPGECDSKITNDDRHYISNFFGRNKSCSTSIPDEFYQVLCRKCMQGMKYRLRGDQGATEIQIQVAAITHAIRNMAASGRWVFMEVQFTKSEYDRRQNPDKYDEETKKFNDEILKAREEAKVSGEKIRRRNTKRPLIPTPDWLVELVVRVDDKVDKTKNYTPVHERNPTRWSFEDLISLVEMIGENCEVLPNIECLPVTQGELDKVELSTALTIRKEAKTEHRKIIKAIETLEKILQENPNEEQPQDDLRTFQESKAAMERFLEDNEKDIKKWSEIQAASAHTLPPKRLHVNKSTTKAESSKTAAKKGKKTKTDTKTETKAETDTTEDHASQETLPDPDIHAKPPAGVPSTDVRMTDADADQNSDLDADGDTDTDTALPAAIRSSTPL